MLQTVIEFGDSDEQQYSLNDVNTKSEEDILEQESREAHVHVERKKEDG
jgi:hypothetical protein